MTAKRTARTPSYRHHKPTNQGFVEVDGQRIYLGRHDSSETREKYHRFVAEWLANDRRLPVDPAEITIVELCAAYWRHVQSYYVRPDGSPTHEVATIKQALRPLKRLYGNTKATDFGPRALKTVRDAMVEIGWCRTNVNAQVGRLKRMFKWAVEQELVEPNVYHGVQAVAALKRGRTDARESKPVKPVPESHVEAIEPHVSRQVWAAVQLQLLTGARPGEVLMLRPSDFDVTDTIWTATLEQHKTSYRGRTRTLYFGPKAQKIVREFMSDRAINDYLFRPMDAEEARRARNHMERKTPPGYGNRPGTNRASKPERTPGEFYTVPSYGRAIKRACAKAGVPGWSPHRLRHNAATLIRREFGLEAAQVILGHSTADITQLYAERDTEKAIAVIGQIG